VFFDISIPIKYFMVIPPFWDGGGPSLPSSGVIGGQSPNQLMREREGGGRTSLRARGPGGFDVPLPPPEI